jgi:CRISPR/Cas system CSM-associated protein Csm3 (group 7 of RAMP superfamily)
MYLGNGDDAVATDQPLQRDAAGRIYLPGTQVAGRLREIAARLAPAFSIANGRACQALSGVDGGFCRCAVCEVFGPVAPPWDGMASDEGFASRVWCFDGPVVGDGLAPSVIRDGVGIARVNGASASEAGAKYDIEWIPTGTCFDVRIEIERSASELAERILALSLSEWCEGRGRLGAAASRGGGAFEVCGLSFRRALFASPADLISFLSEAEPRLRGAEEPDWLKDQLAELWKTRKTGIPEVQHGTRSFAELEYDLAFDGPVLVNDPAVAMTHGFDAAPVHEDVGWSKPVLPGSSIRGVLRAQFERIVRTIASHDAKNLAMFARLCAACDPFVLHEKTHVLRSCARAAGEASEDQKPPACLSCMLFGSTRYGSRLWIGDASLKKETSPEYQLRDFVAIDRFTGGALAGAKFDALPLLSPVFRVRLLLWDPNTWELAGLGLVLRDVSDGLTTIGAHGAKGFGRARVGQLEFRLGDIGAPALDFGAPTISTTSGVFDVRTWSYPDVATFCDDIQRAGWLTALSTRIHENVRPPADQPVDSYFSRWLDGHSIEGLYPLTIDLARLLEEDHAS